MAVTLQFGAVGATNLAATTYGYLQNFNFKYSAGINATCQNAAGNVVAQTITDLVTELDAEYIWDITLGTTLAPGDTLTIGSAKYTVMSVEKTETNNEYSKMKLTCKRYTSGSIPA